VSATRLLILGALRFLQPAHGYSVRRELESWRADEWANIAYGSIYFALNKMAEEGLLQEVEPERPPGRRPARVTYVVTDRGEEEFQRLLRDYWWNRKPLIDPLQLAAAFVDQLPAAEQRAVLAHRLLLAEAGVAEIDHLLNASVMDLKPAHVRDLLDLNRERLLAEISWLRRMLDRIEANASTEPTES
jgi:DNA-binding PadR family transcriptional regulator